MLESASFWSSGTGSVLAKSAVLVTTARIALGCSPFFQGATEPLSFLPGAESWLAEARRLKWPVLLPQLN